MQITISLGGDVQLRRKLGKVAKVVKDWQPAFQGMIHYLENYQKRVFRGKGSAFGLSPWKPLSKKYLEWKKQNYPENAHKILVLRGHMLEGFTDSNSQYAYRRLTKRVMEFGVNETKVPYAAKHQLGEGVPQRKPLRLTRKARSDMGRIMVKRVNDTIKGRIV